MFIAKIVVIRVFDYDYDDDDEIYWLLVRIFAAGTREKEWKRKEEERVWEAKAWRDQFISSHLQRAK